MGAHGFKNQCFKFINRKNNFANIMWQFAKLFIKIFFKVSCLTDQPKTFRFIMTRSILNFYFDDHSSIIWHINYINIYII